MYAFAYILLFVIFEDISEDIVDEQFKEETDPDLERENYFRISGDREDHWKESE